MCKRVPAAPLFIGLLPPTSLILQAGKQARRGAGAPLLESGLDPGSDRPSASVHPCARGYLWRRRRPPARACRGSPSAPSPACRGSAGACPPCRRPRAPPATRGCSFRPGRRWGARRGRSCCGWNAHLDSAPDARALSLRGLLGRGAGPGLARRPEGRSREPTAWWTQGPLAATARKAPCAPQVNRWHWLNVTQFKRCPGMPCLSRLYLLAIGV